MKLGLTQKQLAEIAQCRRQAIIEIEKNQCDTGFIFIEKVINRLGFELVPVQQEPGKVILCDFSSGESVDRKKDRKLKMPPRSATADEVTEDDGIPW